MLPSSAFRTLCLCSSALTARWALSRFEPASVAAAVLGFTLLTGAAEAQTAPPLPTGGAFVAGQGQISQPSAGALAITQTSNRGVIDWSAFSIATGHAVSIDNGAGATLNRVLGGQISQIDGQLSATGSVYLMNPHGVIVGQGGRVITGGDFVATTRQMDMTAFMSGGPLVVSGGGGGAIVNRGEVVSKSGSVVMIARSVENRGVIEAPGGRVTLAAADEVLLASSDEKDRGLYVSAGTGGGDVTQDGRIRAAAVSLQAAGGNIYALAGNRDGLVQATGTSTVDGQLWLTAPKGQVVVSGQLAAQQADGSGGQIGVNGRAVTLASGAVVDARGASGGEVLVGVSGYRRQEGMAETVTVADGAKILAGGPLGGGRIETSAHKVGIGAARVLPGAGGQWLLDPSDLVIDTAVASTIVGTLDSGSDVTQETASGSGGSGDITVQAPIIWTGAGDLTLNAFRDLSINSQISGGGAVTLTAGRDALVSAPVSATSLGANVGGALTISPGGTLAATAGDVNLASASFVNQAGASALTASGDWFVLTDNPSATTLGGLAPAFYQYDFPSSGTPAASGSGVLYRVAPTANVTLGAITKSYDGTTTAVLNNSNTTVTGLLNNDEWTLDGAYADKNVGSGIVVTATNFQASNGGVPVYGYAVNSPITGLGDITRAALSASITGNPTKTYNGTTTVSLTAANFALNGVAAGESLTINGASSQAYDSPNAGSRTVTASLSPTNFNVGAGVNLNNYVLPTTATGVGTIDPAQLLLSGLVANNKVYDSTTAATLNTAGLSIFGALAGDDVQVSSSGATGTFATKNVGTNIAVTVSGFTLSGAAAANYVVAQPTGLAADITKADILITGIAANNKVYDGTTAATLNLGNITANGLFPGDDITPVAGPGGSIQFASKDVGQNIPVSINGISLIGPDAGNYNLLLPAGPLYANITPRPLIIALTGQPTKVYDGTNLARPSLTDFTFSNLVPGEDISIFQAAGANYASSDVGLWNLTVSLTPQDYVASNNTKLSNYTLPSLITGQGRITPAVLSISIINDPTKGYDGNANAFLTPGNFQIDGFVGTQGATVTQTSGQYASSNAGIWNIVAPIDGSVMSANPGTNLSNYVLPASAQGPGTITRITPNLGLYALISGNPTKVYDGNTIATLTPSDYTITGFIPGEGATITQTVGEYAGPDAGQHAVLVQLAGSDWQANPGTNLNNYNLPTEATGLGTILRRPFTASIVGNPTKIYNGTTGAILSAANYQFNNLVAGETVQVAATATGLYDSKNAGSRTITVPLASSQLIFGTGGKASNYILPTSAVGPGTINPAHLSILNVTAQNKVYDATTLAILNTGSAGLFGVVSGDDVTLSAAAGTGTFATANVGAGITVTSSGFTVSGADVGNYILNQPGGLAANITRRGLTIANVTANDKNYDGTTAATLNLGGASLQGVIAGDMVGLDASGAGSAFRQTNVGTNLQVLVGGFALTGASAGNYSLSQPSSVTADINPLLLTGGIIGNPTKTYDGTTSASLGSGNYSLTGFIAGEGGAITQASNGRYDAPNAGARTVSADVVVTDFVANAGTLLSNYILPTTISGAGTINRASLIASIVNNPTKVYDSTTAATLAANNYQILGFVAGEGATVTKTSGAYDIKNVGSRTVTTTLGTGDLTATGSTNLANYVLPTSAAGAGTITPAQLQVINVTANDKVYDATTTATLTTGGATLSGVLGGDVVNVDSSGYSAAFATKNVGTNIPVTATGFTINGGDASNYTLLQPTGLLADITQANLSLAWVRKVYDATTALPTASSGYGLSGVFAGDAVSVDTSGITGAYDTKNVGGSLSGNTVIGGKTVNLTGVAIAGADAGNYAISPNVAGSPIGVITPADLRVVGVVANNKVYDQTTAASLNSSGASLQTVLGTDVVTLDTSSETGVFVDRNAGTNIAVIASGYTVNGADAGNYNLIQPQGLTADITPAEIFLTSVTKTYDGTTLLPTAGAGYGFSGVYSGDVVSANTSSVTGSYADKNVAGSLAGGVVTGGINVTVDGLTLSGAQAGNYFVSPILTPQAIGVITPRQLLASITGNPTKVYDTFTNATLTSTDYTLSGFVAGEGATVTQTAGLYDSKNAGNRTVTATLATGDFTATGGALLTNYTLPTTASGAGTITRAPASVIGAVANNKVYDGTRTATIDNAATTLGGRLGADDLTLVLANNGLFSDRNVGVGKPVTTTDYALSGADAGNYVLSQPNYLTANITQALLTLARVERVYTALRDLPTVSSAYTLSGVVSGDVVTVDASGVSGLYDNKNVGVNKNVTLTGLAISGADAGNYSIASSLTNAPIGTITKAQVSLAGMLGQTRIYDGTINLNLDNAGTIVVGTLQTDDLGVDSSGSSAAFPSKNVGTYSVNASGYVLTGVDAGNYDLVQPTGISATINPKLLTASIVNNPSKTYDGGLAAILAASNFDISGFIAGESATVSQTAGTYDDKNAGPRTVTAGLTSADFTAGAGTLLTNYVLPTSASGAGTITRRGLTATIVGNPTKAYDGGLAALLSGSNYQLAGFVTGEGASVTQTTGQYDDKNAGPRTVSANLGAGDYTADSGTLLSNYDLPTTASGAGTITRKGLTAAIVNNPTKTYDGALAALLNASNFQLSGFVAGEGAAVTQTAGAYADKNAGARLVTADLLAGDFTANAGTQLSNYDLPVAATGMGTIERAILTAAIVNNPTKSYDGTTRAVLISSNYQISGFVAGESASVIHLNGTYDDKNAGPRTTSAVLDASDFTPASGTLLSNYVLPTSATGAGTIDRALVTARIVGVPQKVYDGGTAIALTPANYLLAGIAGGETITVLDNSGDFLSPNVGVHTIATNLVPGDFAPGAGVDLNNYVLPTLASGPGVISARQLTAAIIGNPTKTYDGSALAALTSGNYQLSGFVAGQGATVTETQGLYDSKNAGARTVTAALGSIDLVANAGTRLSNYILPTSATGAGTIDRAALNVSIVGAPTKTYDGTTAALLGPGNFSVTGFITGESATVTQTVGAYDGKDVGAHVVTAGLTEADFAAGAGVLMSNYAIPASASGAGAITAAQLAVALTGVRKTYDGTTLATLGMGNYVLTGFAAGEGANVTQVVGAYAGKDAGSWAVTAGLSSSDFAATGTTQLSNYVLPTSVTGTGLIDPRALTATIVGNPTKTYDGLASATLGGANYQLSGFVSGEGASVTKTGGLYDSKNAGARTVSASLAAGDFTADAGTLLSNYVLPSDASGAGAIDPAQLTVALLGKPSRAYDGTTAAQLASGDFQLAGLVAGDAITVTQTRGTYGDKNAGTWGVTAQLTADDYAAASGVLLSNYTLPTTATGQGVITRAQLTASITGYPLKDYDRDTTAFLVATDYALQGFAPGEGAVVTQTSGEYAQSDPGVWTVTAQLAPSHFLAESGTLLSNYDLPTVAQGDGEIRGVPLTPGCVLTDGVCLPLDVAYTIGNPRFFIPYPTETGLYLGRTNAFGDTAVIATSGAVERTSAGETVVSGSPVLNSTDQVLIQGDRDKQWTLRFKLRPTTIALGAADAGAASH
ncbi:MAG: filamentous hemagglutinin N-terminal domain-containing protein [Caulobacter sp.]|nr:filamentous hemagglutinin N-terminal domain-containing protein [Caulobacter sp.]